MNPPVGTVTFLFTDIEGSSRLWERYPEAMAQSLRRHDTILREAIEDSGGLVFKTIGDAFCAAFDTATDAVRAVTRAQRELQVESWPETGPLKVRMALHTGAAEYRDEDYFGNPLNRVARILAAAHGGQTLISLSVQELVRDTVSAELEMQDLGERKLRGLERPERLFQLNIPGLRSEFPPLRSIEMTPTNLPLSPSSFVGRDRDVNAVREMLNNSRLVTLTGTGGTGKTRMALQIGREMLAQYSDGVWMIELATLTDSTRVPDMVAAALDIREEPGTSVATTLQRALVERELLMILDNCEHLHAACADFAAEVLGHCPRIRVLATSRHSLGISGETAYSVPPLATLNPTQDLFQARDPVQTVSQYDSVRLFLDRAGAVRPDFQITRENAPAIAQICWRLDGIPLAIELAAARVRVLTPEQIAARLDDRFRLLTGGNRAVLPHQQTLRALIDWSYDLLSESERVLLRRLGVFGGGRNLEAIETVCTGEGVDAFDALDLLQQLVDKSLLAMESGPEGAPRYTMIESVWQYTRERLEASGEFPELRRRHLEYFVEQALRAAPGLDGPEVARWLERVDAERGNFRLALDWTIADSSHVSSGLRIAGALTRYWEIRGHIKESQQYFDALLAAAAAQPPSRERASARSGSARMAWVNNDAERAISLYQQAIQEYRTLHDPVQEAHCRCALAFNLRNVGRIEEAGQIFDTIAAEAANLDNEEVMALALSGQAAMCEARGDGRESRRLREQSIALLRKMGAKWAVGYLLWGLARACLSTGDAPAARKALVEWGEITEELKNRWAGPYLLLTFSATLLGENENHAAARVFGAALEAREALGLRFDQVDQRQQDALESELRTLVSPEDFAAEIAAGRTLSIFEAFNYARNIGEEKAWG